MIGSEHFKGVGTKASTEILKQSLRMRKFSMRKKIRVCLSDSAQVGRSHQRQHSGRVSAGPRTGGQQTRAKTRRPQARPLGRTGGQTASLPRTAARVSGVALSCLYMITEQCQHAIASTLLTGTTELGHISSLGPVSIRTTVKGCIACMAGEAVGWLLLRMHWACAP